MLHKGPKNFLLKLSKMPENQGLEDDPFGIPAYFWRQAVSFRAESRGLKGRRSFACFLSRASCYFQGG